jgi:hypothetical protein
MTRIATTAILDHMRPKAADVRLAVIKREWTQV